MIFKILVDTIYYVAYSIAMDQQLKRGLLDVCVLAVLNKGESYGYQIITDLQGIVEISESTLYPILKRLLLLRFVTTRSVEHNGRLRKYYAITPQGRMRINDFLTDSKEMILIYHYIRGDSR